MDQTVPPTERAGAGGDGAIARIGPSVPGRIANEVVASEILDDAAQARARIQALELLLAASRRREEDLTTSVVQGSAVISELYGQLAEMAGTLARAGAAETMLAETERRATAAERRADMLAADLRVRVGEVTELGQRTRTLERDLSAVTSQLAEAAAAHTRLTELERDLDAARSEAEERRADEIAARLSIAEAEAQVATLRTELDTLAAKLVFGEAEGTPPRSGPVIDLRDGGSNGDGEAGA